MNFLAQGAPLGDRRLQTELLRALDATIERHPGHDLGEDVVLARTAPLPDAAVGLIPDRGEMLQHLALQRPGLAIEREIRVAPLMEGVDQFAIDVKLQLRMCGVADPHRLRALIAGKPIGLPFEQPAFAVDAVHDLHAGRIAGDRAQQPIVPGRCLFGVAVVHQREQREGGVAQPAEPVVPIARAAELLRQRGGRRRDDAARWREGQRLQRDQRPHHQLAILALIGAAAGPFGPEILGVLQRCDRIDRLRHRQMRRPVGHHERDLIPLADFELGDRGHVLAVGRHLRPEGQHVGATDRQHRAVVGPPHPRIATP